MRKIPMTFRLWPTASTLLVMLVVAACSDDRSQAPEEDAEREVVAATAAGSQSLVVYAASSNAQIGPVLEAYTAETGVKINLVVDDLANLVARIERSGSGSVADLLIATNVGDLWNATEKDIYRPVYSAIVAKQVPENLRDAEKLWHALSVRARIVVYNTTLAEAAQVATISDYGSLGDESWRGKLCLSSSSVPGNRSLIAYLIKKHGARNAELIVRGWQANLAAPVFSDDNEVMQAIVDGRCAIGIADSNDLALLIRGRPNAPLAAQWFAEGSPVYIDVTGAGVTRHAENSDGAAELLEWLTTDQPNALFAALGLEFPASPTAPVDASIKKWHEYVAQPTNVSEFGYFQDDATKLAERAHYP
jgi:iron(III) transport system substrate-binding protein